MFGFSILVIIASIIALITGLIKPSLFNKVFKGEGTRKKISWAFLGTIFLFTIIMGVTAPKSPTQSTIYKQVTTPPPAQTTATATSQKQLAPPTAQLSNQQLDNQAATILTDNLNNYKQLLQQGKQILGTTPYGDANSGLIAMQDPNSAASKFGVYRNSVVNDMSYNDAFSKADANFKADNEPSSINAWREDIIQASSDLDVWANKAVDWQIGEISASQLSGYEQKVIKDFTQVEIDIGKIKSGK